MAPVKSNALGIAPQMLDDPELINLLKELNGIAYNDFPSQGLSGDDDPSSIERLINLVEPYPTWQFEEQVDLLEWIAPLNAIDSALAYMLQKYPGMVLIEPVKQSHKKQSLEQLTENKAIPQAAKSMADVERIAAKTTKSVCILLRFLRALLRNATNKSVFNSADEVGDLLAAADDIVAGLALEVLAAVATPPSLHKQTTPEVHQHSTALHSPRVACHRRLLALARGWGSRGAGLGLFQCVTADDSEFGQGGLPAEAGSMYFQYFSSERIENMSEDGNISKNLERSVLTTIHLPVCEIIEGPLFPNSDNDRESENEQKRRKIGSHGSRGRRSKSTAELFFQCIKKAGGTEHIPQEQLFPLLADIRLARSFHSHEGRVVSVEHRLVALIAILYAHPSQEIMSGYFQAQPELCGELIDLLGPSVSAATVSAASTNQPSLRPGSLRLIESLANPPAVPSNIRNLAIEALTALVARREGASGGLTGVARQSNILNELGVGKGLYLGLLPTLIRFTLVSLNTFLNFQESKSIDKTKQECGEVCLDLGLAFLEASAPQQSSTNLQMEKALVFIDILLTLVSTVVSTPSGTASLTDCGIIPTLLGTIALESNTKCPSWSLPNLGDQDIKRVQAHLRFISAQAIQIIEGSIATHTNALTVFHDLNGVEVLISRLYGQILETKEFSNDGVEGDAVQVTGETRGSKICSSRRVLIFSIVNCLSVVFHQESTSSSSVQSTGGTLLRKPELTFVLNEIIENAASYGGSLTSIAFTLMSDIMNSDPHVVKHVHSSGLAAAIFKLLSGDEKTHSCGRQEWIPHLPPIHELVTALPNLISALALTAEGAVSVQEANPFLPLLKIFFHADFAMPSSRCLLNETSAIIGTGLDELMRHVPSLRAQVLGTVVDSLNNLIKIGLDLRLREETLLELEHSDTATPLEEERSCLMQYVLNFGQIMEQVLQTEEECTPFVQSGGLDAILRLFPLLMPSGTQFLASASCLTCPSISSLAHSTTEESLNVAFKCIATQFDTLKLLKTMITILKEDMHKIEKSQALVRSAFSNPLGETEYSISALGMTDGLNRAPFFTIRDQNDFLQNSNILSEYLRDVTTLHWHTRLLGTAICAASQRSQDGVTGWGRNEREWKKLLSSEEFEVLVCKISEFHQTAVLESCRFRSEPLFEACEKSRLTRRDSTHSLLCYKLRIVCQEGAVVRDGIEIDSCANIGSMEMGEIVIATDRCLNSSGVMRYRSQRGWVSELTRGHGREAIAEVIDVYEVQINVRTEVPRHADNSKKRIEYGVSSVAGVVASIFSRLQTSYCDLFSSLSRIITLGIRALPARSISFQSGTVGAHVRSLLHIMTLNIVKGFNHEAVVPLLDSMSTGIKSNVSRGAAALYLSAQLNHFQTCFFEEKRERRTINLLLLIFLLKSDPQVVGLKMGATEICFNFFGAIKFVFDHAFTDLSMFPTTTDSNSPKHSVIGRSVAATLPTVIVILRRMVSASVIKSSPLITTLEMLREKDVFTLLGGTQDAAVDLQSSDADKVVLFSANRFTRALFLSVATITSDIWNDPRFATLPAHILHPVALLANDIVSGLEDAANTVPKVSNSSEIESAAVAIVLPSHRSGMAQSIQRRSTETIIGLDDAGFEASEEAITLLTDMGFGYDHALAAIESTRSNDLVASMEFALSQPPPSPASAERRRIERRARMRLSALQEEDIIVDSRIDATLVELRGTGTNSDLTRHEVDNDLGIDSGGLNVGESMCTDIDEMERVDPNDMQRDCIQSSLSTWTEIIPKVTLGILSGVVDGFSGGPRSAKHVSIIRDNGDGQGNGDTEGLTVVISSCLLWLCQKYPDKCDNIVGDLLSRLKNQFEVEIINGSLRAKVQLGKECSFAALCHATVLFTRALPKTRISVLQNGLVHCLVCCTSEYHINNTWPIWLAPALLLLEVMAQPMAAFSEEKDNITQTKINDNIPFDELQQVRDEHMNQGKMVSSLATAIFCPSDSKSLENLRKLPMKSETEAVAQAVIPKYSVNDDQSESKPFLIPPYYPLIPNCLNERIMLLCLRVIRFDSNGALGERTPPPGIVHAALLLLTRLARSPKIALQCLKLGAVNLVLSLPRLSRFIGNVGVATIFFRRLIEDETTLHTLMETEIRSTLSKLHRKENKASSSSDKPMAPLPLFIQSVTPLICRDPIAFIKAAAVTVNIESELKSDSTKSVVSLLNVEQRSKKVKESTEMLWQLEACTTQSKSEEVKFSSSTSTKNTSFGRKSLSSKGSLGKSPIERSQSKRVNSLKSAKRDQCDISSPSKKENDLAGSPSNYVTSLLVGKVLSLSSTAKESTSGELLFGENTSFLWAADLVEILADLVLAIPTCAAAIHRYREKELLGTDPLVNLQHALSNCPPPPKTMVSFLLHKLLPQDRWSLLADQDMWDRRRCIGDKFQQKRNKDFHIKTRIAQKTARLLVALVARAGEGRRRVLADLAFALSGGSMRLFNTATTTFGKTELSSTRSPNKENCALQAWGDLCIGLAAPRSNGVSHESNMSLSYEVIKLMLDFGTCHALLRSIERIPLQHPMASQVCASLLIPLEVFTRSSVTDQVQAIADKDSSCPEKSTKLEESNVETKKDRKKDNRVSLGPSQRMETSFADDTMLEAGFDVDAARSRPLAFDIENDDESMIADEEDDDTEEDEDDDDDDAEEEDEDVVVGIDADMGEAEIDEEISSDDDSHDDIGDGTDVDSSEDIDDEDDSDSDIEEGDIESVGNEESNDDDNDNNDGDGWDMVEEDLLVPGEDFFEGDMNNDEAVGQLHAHLHQLDGDPDDGWTRVEGSSNIRSLLLGTRRHAMRNGLQGRGRGFMDAAEAMIGTLLRTGSIEHDVLAEIEGNLGMRVSNRGSDMFREGRGLWNTPGIGGLEDGDISPSERGRRIGALVNLPHINQRPPPDIGYSALGTSGSRWGEISSVEYVYGGPSVASGSGNYDIFAIAQADEATEMYPTPSLVDSQLFPGGPAASTHSRTQQPIHPLLCGVELPPLNAMVSGLLPNDQRSFRLGRSNTCRLGEWGSLSMSSGSVLVSTTNGNLMRLNRGLTSSSDMLPLRGVNNGLVGWTDDGLPLDATLGEFATSFQQALDVSRRSHQSHSDQQQVQCLDSSGTSENINGGESTFLVDEVDNSIVENIEMNDNSEATGEVQVPSELDPQCTYESTPLITSNVTNPLEGNDSSDGDGVASSLAVGLRLSHPSERSLISNVDGNNSVSDSACPTRVDQNPDSQIEGIITSPGLTDSHQYQVNELEVITNVGNVVYPGDQAAETNIHDGERCSNFPESSTQNTENAHGVVCPAGMDLEVFNDLPVDVQREIAGHYQMVADVAAQLDATSGLDPESLAALPEDLRQEIIAQEQRERLMQAPVDPSNAEEMDNASFLASLSPDLREEILLTADDTVLSSLPPNILAEAQVLRERVSIRRQALQDGVALGRVDSRNGENAQINIAPRRAHDVPSGSAVATGSSRKKSRPGSVKVDLDRDQIIYLPRNVSESLETPFGSQEVKCLLQLMFLRSPVRPQRLLQKLFQNLCVNSSVRGVLSTSFAKLLNDDGKGVLSALAILDGNLFSEIDSDHFPPRSLIGAAPEVLDSNTDQSVAMFRRRQVISTATSIASNLPSSARGCSSSCHIPPVVATRVIDTLSFLGKNSTRLCLDILANEKVCDDTSDTPQTFDTCFEELLDLLILPRYTKSSNNLEQLLTMLEIFVAPLASLPRDDETFHSSSEREIDSTAGSGKERVTVPRIIVSPARLQILCSILKLESCRETAFTKVNTIASRLCNISANRGFILSELASVAQSLGDDAIRDLRALSIRMSLAASRKNAPCVDSSDKCEPSRDSTGQPSESTTNYSSSSVTLSSSSSELKLLRVLQTLQSLCSDNMQEAQNEKKQEANTLVSHELTAILNKIQLAELWKQLSACLNAVKILEGISIEIFDEKHPDNGSNLDDEIDTQGEDDSEPNAGTGGKKLQNSAAGLLTRFLPSIEAFFVVNATAARMNGEDSATETTEGDARKCNNRDLADTAHSDLAFTSFVGEKLVIEFVSENKILLNALIRNNSGLLDRGLKSMVQLPRFRSFLDFDVKRQWFKNQIRRLRQHASRRHGSLRLIIRRKNVFEEAYHQLRLRNEDEMRSRLHITFRNEEGVDAGGLSREFFGILAKEMFNPNYALFTSTEDGCTFQPNQHSSINPDHLSYFRFVGRIVGKALADGFLLDAHFTRSLYKHMLGLEPTHHDMEAIDPNYYKNLKIILEYSLIDIGLDLTFSIEDHSFGRNQIVDLIPNGRTIPVTDETKAQYVSLVCQHRMTNAIQSQIKAYLDGFYELVSPELIVIFSPRELELLISGLPDIDILDLKKNTEYQGWKTTDTEIEWFWNIMVSLSRNQKASFLQFVTGSSKVPLAGFSELQGMRGIQKFSIHKASGSNGALMSAHTCFNSLDLPVYKSEEEMREKFLYAISEGQGAFMFA